jgi:hypothetical protein
MDVATTTEVETTVAALISKRKSFSAFDITKTVRAAGFKERHKDVKQVVHQLYGDEEMSDYTRTLVNFPGGNGPAFLYHPPEVDPNLAVSDQTIQTGSPTPSSTMSNQNTKGQKQPDGSFLKAIGTRGIVYVPQAFVYEIGGSRGGRDIFYKVDAGNIVLRTDLHNPASFYNPTTGLMRLTGTPTPKWHKAQIDNHDNIRIGKTALQEAGIAGSVKIEVRGGTGKNAEILVTQG